MYGSTTNMKKHTEVNKARPFFQYLCITLIDFGMGHLKRMLHFINMEYQRYELCMCNRKAVQAENVNKSM